MSKKNALIGAALAGVMGVVGAAGLSAAGKTPVAARSVSSQVPSSHVCSYMPNGSQQVRHAVKVPLYRFPAAES